MKQGVFCSVLTMSMISINCLDHLQHQSINRPCWTGFHYNNNSVIQYNLARTLLRTITFNGDENVLDISSNERIGVEIAKYVPNGFVTVLHPSSDLIDFARITYSPKKNLSFELGDLATANLNSSSYNLVTSFGSLGWVEDKHAALIKIAAACKENAKVCIGVSERNSDYLSVRTQMLTHDKWKEFFVDYKMPFFPTDEDEMREYLIQAGFTIISLEKRVVDYTFSSRNSLRDWLIAIPLQYDQIPLERQEEFLDDMIDSYLQITGQQPGGSIVLSLNTLLIVADK